MGDKEHFLRRCENSLTVETRNKFVSELKKTCPLMATFSVDNIISYCIRMNDPSIQLPMAIYAKEIIETYSEIRNLQSIPPASPKKARLGRLIKKPEKLDL